LLQKSLGFGEFIEAWYGMEQTPIIPVPPVIISPTTPEELSRKPQNRAIVVEPEQTITTASRRPTPTISPHPRSDTFFESTLQYPLDLISDTVPKALEKLRWKIRKIERGRLSHRFRVSTGARIWNEEMAVDLVKTGNNTTLVAVHSLSTQVRDKARYRRDIEKFLKQLDQELGEFYKAQTWPWRKDSRYGWLPETKLRKENP
jgi:hypothetical protein